MKRELGSPRKGYRYGGGLLRCGGIGEVHFALFVPGRRCGTQPGLQAGQLGIVVLPACSTLRLCFFRFFLFIFIYLGGFHSMKFLEQIGCQIITS